MRYLADNVRGIGRAGIAAAFVFLMGATPAPAQNAPASAPVTYQHDIRPLFKKRCGNCHNADVRRGELDLSTYAAAIEGSVSGPIAVKGRPKESLLYLATQHLETPHMPPGKNKLPESELALIQRWIEDGLLEDRPAAGAPGSPESKTAPAAAAVDKQEKKPVADSDAKTSSAEPAADHSAPAVPTPAPRGNAVTALAAHPTEPLLAVAGQGQVALFNAGTQRLEFVLPFPEGEAFVLRFSRSGRLLLAAGGEHVESGSAVVWDLATRRRIASIGDEADVVLAADISPDESLVALGGPSRLVKIHRLSDGTLVHRLEKHTDWVLRIAFSPEGLLFATADRAGNLFIWETERGDLVHTLRGHRGMIAALDWRPDGDGLASGGDDGTIRLWSAHDGSEQAMWKAHGKGITDLQFLSPSAIVSAGRDRFCRTWTASGESEGNLPELKAIPLRISQVARLGTLAVGDWAGEVALHERASGRLVAALPPVPAAPAATPVAPAVVAGRGADKTPPEAWPARDEFDRLLAEAAATRDELNRLIDGGRRLSQRAEAAETAAGQARVAVKEATENARQALQSLESAAKVIQEMRQLERRAGSENSRAKQSQVAEGQPAGPQNRQSAAATRKARSEQLEKMLAEVLKSLPAEEGGNERLAEAALLVRLAAEKAAAATEAAGRDVDEEGNAAGQKRVERNETAAEAPSIDRDPRHREAFQQARQNYNRAAETLKNSQERLRVAEQSLREALGESNAASAGVSTAN